MVPKISIIIFWGNLSSELTFENFYQGSGKFLERQNERLAGIRTQGTDSLDCTIQNDYRADF